MVTISRKTREISAVALEAIAYDDIIASQQPVIIKGAVKDWPLVQKGLESAKSAMDYIKSFYSARPVTGFIGAPEIKGRFFYDETVTARNFDATTVKLDEFLDQIHQHLTKTAPPSFYVGSTDVDLFLPGLREHNDLMLDNCSAGDNHTFVSMWMGNKTVASAHYDISNNIACCMVGKRRFTLFPPDQVHNLYPGPLEPTPGGQVVSMVDFDNPDLEKHPRFTSALEAGQVADLEPGDMLIYPAMWWHQVEALADFNVMINYWWNDVPDFIDDPMNTLLQGLLSLRDRPDHEKKAWQELFNYYIFGPADTAAKHLPEPAQGPLGPMDEMKARRLRAYLLQRFNR